MNKLVKITSLLIIALAWTSCETGPSETESAYEELMAEHDSLRNIGEALKDSIDKVRGEHDLLMAKVEAEDTAAVDLSDDMAMHQSTFNELNEIVSRHNQWNQQHEALEEQKADMTEEELQEKIDEMEQHHEKMTEDHEHIRSKLDEVKGDHERIRQTMKENENWQENEAAD